MTQLSAAKDVADKQKLLIDALEQRDVIRGKEAEAYAEAAKAQTAAKDLYVRRAIDATEALTKAQQDLEAQRRKGTRKFWIGLVTGAVMVCVLAVAVN